MDQTPASCLPSTETSTSKEPDLELPNIDGIDMTGGLARVAGNKRLYRSLLEQFAAKQADTVQG